MHFTIKQYPIMKKTIINKLTVQEQIEVLEEAIQFINKKEETFNFKCGICYAIKNVIIDKYNKKELKNDLIYELIPKLIPLFKRENAMKFNASYGTWWWELNEDGMKHRKEFINWMIIELKK